MSWVWTLARGRVRRVSRLGVLTLEERIAPAAHAVADVNGDKVPDLIASTGTTVTTVSGADGRTIHTFVPFEETFAGPLSVAAADLDGDGAAEVVVGAGEGGGPRVRAFDGRTGETVWDVFVYEDTFRGGVNVAAGDVTGDGTPDLIAGAGVGGGPRVRAFDGATRAGVQDFFAYEETFRGGVNVAAGDVRGDGVAAIVTGAGVGGGPRVRAFVGPDATPLRNEFTADSAGRDGVQVAAADADGNGLADVVALAGGRLRVFGGTNPTPFEDVPTGAAGVAGGDLDGDRAAELLTSDGTTITALGGQGLSPTGFAWSPGASVGAFAVAAVDFGTPILSGSTLTIPGPATGSGEVTLTTTRGYATPAVEFGLYPVADAAGRVGSLLPGDAGYLDAALANRATGTTTAAGGSRFGLYALSNGERFVSFAAANPGGAAQFRLLATNRLVASVDPLGGFGDFNSLIADVRVKLAQPPTSPPPVTVPPDVPPTTPPTVPPTNPPTVPPPSPPTVPPLPVVGNFPPDLAGWTPTDLSGGTNPGTATVTDGFLTLTEGDSFRVGRAKPFTVPDTPAAIAVALDAPAFDTSSVGRVRDAFEVAVLDADGSPLALPIAAGRDAVFNWTEGFDPVAGPAATYAGGWLTINLSALPAGTAAQLVLRLVNNDTDTTTSVRIRTVEFAPTTAPAPAGVAPSAARPNGGAVDLAPLADVTPSATAEYGRTTLTEANTILATDLSVRNTGGYALAGALVAVVGDLSDPAVGVLNPDGFTADGRPYFDLTREMGTGLAPGSATAARTVRFANPNRTRFTYALTVRSGLNQVPTLAAVPDATAEVGAAFTLTPAASDPDGGPLAFTLPAGPTGMTIDPATGTLRFTPSSADLGTHTVVVRVADALGASAQIKFALMVRTTPPNRPPVITSTPPTDATVARPFEVLTYATGDSPVSVAAADFGTGVSVVTANPGDQTLGLLSGPNYATTPVGVGEPPPRVYGTPFVTGATVDLGFVPNTYRNVERGVQSLVAADVNADGNPDFLVSVTNGTNDNEATQTGSVGVRLGTGDGTFRPGWQTALPAVAVGGFTYSARADTIRYADVTGDAVADVVAVQSFGGRVLVYAGTGGGFADTPIASDGAGVGGAQLADVNGDGQLDVVLFENNHAGRFRSGVSVRLGDGTGRFAAAAFAAAANDNGGQGYVADVNADGKPDAVRVNSADQRVEAYLGDGTGAFAAPVFSANAAFDPASGGKLSDAATSAYVADFDADGTPDVATSTPAHGFFVLRGNGDGTYGDGTPAGNRLAAPTTGWNYGVQPFPAVIGSDGTPPDLNGDGRPDLLFGNNNQAAELVVGLNAGGGFAFTAYGGFAADDAGTGSVRGTAATPYLAVADFNRDGVRDVLYAHVRSDLQPGSVGLSLGDAPGTLRLPRVTHSTEVGAGPNAVADFTGDGLPDVATLGQGQVAVAAGRGDGTFAPFQTAAQVGGDGFSGNTLVAADFDADGNQDIAWISNGGVQGSDTARFRFAFGLGNGTFQPAPAVNVPGNLRSGSISSQLIAAGDFNGDGHPDLAFRVQGNGFTRVDVLLYDPAGRRFALATDADGLLGPLPRRDGFYYDEAIAFADLDGDGKGELFAHAVSIGDAGGNVVTPERLYVWTPTLDKAATDAADLFTLTVKENPNFSGRSPGEAASVLGYVVADFNRDGTPDVAVAGRGNTTTVMTGNGDWRFRDPTVHLTYSSTGIRGGDVNGDGITDIIGYWAAFIAFDDRPTSGVMLGRADGTFGPYTGFRFATSNEGYGLAVGDFNLDGKTDLVGQYQRDSAMAFAAAPPGLAAVATGDLDRDGKQDLVAVNAGFGRVKVLLGNGDDTFRRQPDLFAGLSPEAVAVADVTGDGTPDIVTANRVGKSLSLFAGGGFARTDFPLEFQPTLLALGDLNGDGRADAVAAGGATLGVLLGTASGFATAVPLPLGFVAGGLELADVTGDGRLDAILSDPAGKRLLLLPGVGDGTFGPPTLVPLTAAPGKVAAADLNADGKADLVVTFPAADRVGILFGRGGGRYTTPQMIAVGDNPVSLAVRDANGDGKPDLLVTSAGDDTLSLILNRYDPTTLFKYTPAAADPDGDPVAFDLSAAPGGMLLDDATGTLLWAPMPEQLGANPVVLRATDGRGGAAEQGFTIKVAAPTGSLPPSFTSEPVESVAFDAVYRYQPRAANPGGGPVRYSLVNGPAGMTVDPTTGAVAWDARRSGLSFGVFQPNLQTPQFVSRGRVEVPDSASLRTASVTAEGWFRFDTNAGFQSLVRKNLSDPFFGYAASWSLENRGGILVGRVGDGTDAVFVSAPVPLPVGVWVHLAMTFDAASRAFALFVNGEGVAGGVAARPIGYDGQPLWVGHNSPATVTAVRVWGVARTPEQIRAGMLADVPANAAGLVLDFRFAETRDVATVLDSSPAGNHGSIADTTGRYQYPPRVPTLAVGGDHPATIRVEDGKGGISEQTFTIRVASPFPVRVSGTVFDDANGNGVRDRRPGGNLVVNGDFASGAVGFASELAAVGYSEDQGSLPAGAYTVGRLARALPNGPTLPGHTGGTGGATLLVRGLPADRVVWAQTVLVAAGQSYAVGFWAMRSGPGTPPPRFVVRVNGQVVGDPLDFAAIDYYDWGRFAGTWAAGGATTAHVEIVLLGDPGGTAAAVDDINLSLANAAVAVVRAADDPWRIAPTAVPNLPLVAGQELRFDVAGTANTGPFVQGYSPDGTPADLASVGGVNGLSAVSLPTRAGLLGVFLSEDAPAGDLPTTLDFRGGGTVPGGIDYLALAPHLRQVFFIGDGRTADGTVQRVTVPAGATRLVLGTADGSNWADNYGGFDVRVFAADDPEPALAGRTVYLDADGNGRFDAGEPTATTDAAGVYAFTLNGGAARVGLMPEAGRRQTTPAAASRLVDLASDADRIDFGSAAVADGPPAFVSVAPTAATVPGTFIYAAFAQAADGSAVRYAVAVGPAGMVIDPASGRVSWTPKFADAGPVDVILTATDAAGRVGMQAFRVAVSVNTPPVVTSVAPNTAFAGVAFRYDVAAQDAEQSALQFALENAPSWLGIDPATGRAGGTPALGTFAFTVVVRDGAGGEARQAVMLNIVAAGPNRDPVFAAGPRANAQVGAAYRSRVTAIDPDGDARSFALVSGPAGLTVSDEGGIAWTPRELGPQVVRVRVSDGHGGSAEQEFTIAVGPAPVAVELAITSVPPLNAVAGRPYAYDLVAPGAVGFQLVNGPVGLSIDPTRGRVRWVPAAEQLGLTAVTVRAIDDLGNVAEQAFTLTVRGSDLLPAIVSVPPTEAAVGATYLYPLRVNNPAGSPLTFALTVAPAGMTIDAATGVVSWTPASDQTGPRSVVLRVGDGVGHFASQAFEVVVAAGVPNHPPAAASVPPLDATVGAMFAYTFAAADPDGESLVYSVVRGPAELAIDPMTGVVAWVPNEIGSVAITLAATDPRGGAAVQSFVVDVRAANRPPRITTAAPAGVSQGATYMYDVRADDPDREPLFYAVVSGPAGATIDALGRLRWATALDTPLGPREFAVRVSDGRGGSDVQTFAVNVVPDVIPPRVSVLAYGYGAALYPWSTQPARVRVTATDDVAVTQLVLLVDGQPVALRADGTADVYFSAPGKGGLLAYALDPAGNKGQATNRVNMRSGSEDGSGNGAAAPAVSIDSVAAGDAVGGFVSVVGTAASPDLDRYTLSYRRADQAAYTVFATGTASVTAGPLGRWDTTLLENDAYVLKLEATDVYGGFAAVEREVGVSGNLKLGNFRLSFADLTVPVAGLPITLARTYDSLRADRPGDFGYGWRLEYRNTDLRVSLPKSGLEDLGLYTPFRPGVKVYLTLPGGTREGFTFTPDVRVLPGFGGQGLAVATPRFTPDRGVRSTLSAGGGTLIVNEYGELTTAGGVPWNPANPDFGGGYTLTTSDGTVYRIDGTTGLLASAADRNGNTLTFSDAGVTSSSGVGVTFERDAKGRITKVTDPAGQSLTYAYTAAGDLASVTDRTGNVTRFTYRTSPKHYLESVTDPLGRTGARAEYDANGRLVGVSNAAGGRAGVSYDPDNDLVTTTDPLGNPTTTEYDAAGNVVAVTDAAGGATRYTYDAANNELTRTDPLGQTTTRAYDFAGNVVAETDPLGNVTRTTYGAFGRPLTETDPLGRTTRYAYDAAGNLLAATDPGGATTRFTNDAAGNPTAVTDPLGRVTRYAYDAAGNAVAETDPTGHTRTTSYTPTGLVLGTSETVIRPGGVRVVVTSRQYDANGRLVAETDAEGGVTRTEYDAAGQRVAVVDPLGRRTAFEYDAAGRLARTRFADSTTTATAYDAAGRIVTETDQAGNVTRYVWDALGRRVAAILPDATPDDPADNPRTGIEYDAAGNVIARIDELGNRTTFVRDAAGRLVDVIDALGNYTRSGYDAAGQLVSLTDPRGFVTRFEYDAAGLPSRTTRPDGTATHQTYDAAGQLVREADGLGHVTTYAYDPRGWLAAVTDPLGGVTAYAYDELGSRTGQTDANGHVTRYEYDALGRTTAVVRPSGDRLANEYDAAGNLVRTTDFNGNATRYEYDALNREAARRYADGSAVVFTYTPTGLRATEQDARGVTIYQYDARGELTRRTDPDGRSVAYTYDAAANVLSVSTFAGTTAYTYDPLNRVATATAADGTTTLVYDAAGRRTATLFPNGTAERVTYDGVGRIASVRTESPAGAVLSAVTYAYDAGGRRVSAVEGSGRTTRYEYDAAGRLARERVTDAAGTRTTDYVLDAVGNRLRRTDTTDGVTTYAYEANDRLLAETTGPATTAYTYDANGNRLTETGPGESQAYGYDAADRLVSVVRTDAGGTDRHTFGYAADGTRVSQAVNGVETRLLVDANRHLSRVLAEYAPGVTTADATYVHAGGLLSQTRDGATVYFHPGPLGTTRLLTDAAGAVAARYAYDAFGNPLAPTAADRTDYLFTGEPFDPELGLLYLRARYYDAATGRFVGSDPYAGTADAPVSLHRFLYANADPVNHSDPTGRNTLAEVLTSSAILVPLGILSIYGAKFVIRNATIVAKQYINRYESGVDTYIYYTQFGAGAGADEWLLGAQKATAVNAALSIPLNSAARYHIDVIRRITERLYNNPVARNSFVTNYSIADADKRAVRKVYDDPDLFFNNYEYVTLSQADLASIGLTAGTHPY